MKEIMIIDIYKICEECKFNTSYLCDKSRQNVVSCEEGKEEATVIEQVPETFEELKELCEKLCEKIKVIEAYTEYISCHKFLFWKNGAISSETDDGEEIVYIADRTPQQMWQIIKNLIGE